MEKKNEAGWGGHGADLRTPCPSALPIGASHPPRSWLLQQQLCSVRNVDTSHEGVGEASGAWVTPDAYLRLVGTTFL